MNPLYIDNELIVCVKPCGVLSTDEPGGMPELLREMLADPNAEVLTVHRLDRVVGGLMVFARNKTSAGALSRQITEGSFQKDYLAVVHGCPDPSEGRMEDLLFRDSAENKTYVVKRMRKGVRPAALEYQVIRTEKGLSLVRIHLLTGRTHQIRAQFSSRAMPLVGDRKYGAAGDSCEIALWSCALRFSHPRTGKPMDFSLSPPGGEPWDQFGYRGEPAPSVRQIPPPGPSENSTHGSCPVAGQCGGCQFLSLPYAHQLETKRKRLEDLLGSFGEILPVIGMEDPFHYRNKVQAAFGYGEKGRIISGNYKSGSHKIIPSENCLINDACADRIIADIRSMMRQFQMTAYDEQKRSGFLRHVLVKRGFSTGEVMVVLVAASSVFKLRKPFLRALLEKHPEITTVILNINSAYTPVVLGREEKILYGPGTIEDILCGHRFRISPRSFYQINPVQTEKLYKTAIEFAGLTGSEHVLDAYCGTGTIGISAAGHCATVTGVELNRDAVRDAIANAKRNGIGNIRFVCADAGEFMLRMAQEKQHCDVVFMDPPRSGSEERFLSSLVKMKPDRIVYISCGPDSLARDLKMLTATGYRAEKIQPVDMFPHTEHVETVVLLSRRKDEPRVQMTMHL